MNQFFGILTRYRSTLVQVFERSSATAEYFVRREDSVDSSTRPMDFLLSQRPEGPSETESRTPPGGLEDQRIESKTINRGEVKV